MSKEPSPHESAVCRECGKGLPENSEMAMCPQCLWVGVVAQDGAGKQGTASEKEVMAELRELLPQFEWLGILGRGGMGTVYKARQTRLDRVVAVKILAEEISVDTRFASRFEREAKILARLNHPHIVTIHDFGQELGLYYLVMELVDGLSLAQLLRRGPVPVEQSIRIARQLCAALVFAHDRQVLHRDIKPANVLLDRDGLVKMADFGLAKLGRLQELGETLTVAGRAMGTPRYMAPEQWASPEAIDHRADLFAFGMVFYELLTAEVPSGMIELPSTRLSVDARADEVVRRCLAQDPEKRYASARELESDLVALERTTSVSRASGGAESWLRPAPVQLAEPSSEVDSRVETAVKVSSREGPGTPSSAPIWTEDTKRETWGTRRKLITWAMSLMIVGLLVGGLLLTDRGGPAQGNLVRLSTLPALKAGTWWFEDAPYLIPPVRAALMEAGAMEVPIPQTPDEVETLAVLCRQKARAFSETSEDPVMHQVLGQLLIRRPKPALAARLIPAERAEADPAWRHAQAVLEHQSGELSKAITLYQAALRAYHADTSKPNAKPGLLALCLSDLGRAYAASGLDEEAYDVVDRAIEAVAADSVSLFRAVCLAEKAGVCRRLEAWEEAEEALLGAAAELENAGVEEGHPLHTYIRQRFGWLYMDGWRLKEARAAFRGAIRSREEWVRAVEDRSLFTELQQQHDELALAMCQRYSGQLEEAVQHYGQVRRSLHGLLERVRRNPAIERDWQVRYYNTRERYGDCFLFGSSEPLKAAHHFEQAAEDLERELAAMDSSEAMDLRWQYGRFLAKATMARVLSGQGNEAVEAFLRDVQGLDLGGGFLELIDLFGEIAQLLVAAREEASVAPTLDRLIQLVDANQEKQFGRDVREMFLLVAKTLASRCEAREAGLLANVMIRMLPRPPVDRSVLPFLRSHFDGLLALKLTASGEDLDWSTVRDVHWAKEGFRLGEDLPIRPLVMMYLMESASLILSFHPDGTQRLRRVPYGVANLEKFGSHALVTEVIEGTFGTWGGFDLYWSDSGLIPPQTPETLPFSIPQEVKVH